MSSECLPVLCDTILHAIVNYCKYLGRGWDVVLFLCFERAEQLVEYLDAQGILV